MSETKENKIDKMREMADGFLEKSTLWRNSNVEFHVMNHIPYREMEDAALEYSMLMTVTDDEREFSYPMYCREIFDAYIFAKYFTDLDIEDVGSRYNAEAVYDYLNASDIFRGYEMPYDMETIREMADRMMENYMEMYKHDHSLTTKLGKLADMDWTKEMAQANDVNQNMIELLSAVTKKDKEKPPINLAGFAKK